MLNCYYLWRKLAFTGNSRGFGGRELWSFCPATLDDLREAVTTLEDTDRIAQRVLGGAHPFTEGVVRSLRIARAALRARDTAPSGSA